MLNNFTFAQGSEKSNLQGPPTTITSSMVIDDGAQTKITTQHYNNVNPDTVAQIISDHSLLNDHSREIIVSTDSEKVVTAVVNEKSNISKKPQFMFFGSILANSATNKIGRGIKDATNHVINSAKSDKIGLLIVTINTAYDSYLWMHAESISVTQSTAQIILGLILAVSFGLDKDLWSKMTKPLENKIMSSMSYLGLVKQPNDLNSTQRLASQFFANLAFSASLQVLRMGIISIDHIVNSLQSSQFWTTSLLIGLALTASSFAWSEQLARIDINKHPVAKNIMRRVTDIRNLALGHLAPSSKILQPDVYGYGSWVALGASAIAGLIVWVKSERLIHVLESSDLFQKSFKHIMKIDNVVNKHIFRAKPLMCSSLFG